MTEWRPAEKRHQAERRCPAEKRRQAERRCLAEEHCQAQGRPAVERRGRIEHPYLQSERNSHNHVRCKYFCQRNMPEQMVGEVVKIEQRQTRCSQPKGRKRPVEGAPKRRALRSHASEHPPIGPLPADNANRRKRNRQQPRQRRLPRPGAIHEEHCEKRACADSAQNSENPFSP